MGSQPKDGRAVNWSFPMNPTHLPPKSPTFPGFGSLFESSALPFAGRSNYPSRGGPGHKRTTSTGFLPQVQPSWLDDVIDPQDLPVKRGGHRRSSSDSVAFLDSPRSYSLKDEHIAEEDEFDARSTVSIPSGRGSLDFDRLDEEQLMSMFTDIEPFQQGHRGPNHGESSRAQSVSNAVPSSAADSWTSDRRTANATTPDNNPSTPSDSNSLSEVSNDGDKGTGKIKSEPEVQSMAEGEDHGQSSSKGELQGAGSSQLDPNLDPKRAKRILANRQSAQRSRVRKLQYISELERNVSALQTEVSTLSPQVAYLDHQRVVLNVDNNSLKQKIAALAQDKRFKDAHNEALKKEVQRLRQQLQQQHHQMQQQHLQQQHQQQIQSATPTAYEVQQQQFSKLDISSAESKHAGSSGVTASGAISAHRGTGRPMVMKGSLGSSSCMAPGINKGMDGRLMNGSGPLQSDFMVHNP
ncbi:unnamed protein product [Calypogeia fissa]